MLSLNLNVLYCRKDVDMDLENTYVRADRVKKAIASLLDQVEIRTKGSAYITPEQRIKLCDGLMEILIADVGTIIHIDEMHTSYGCASITPEQNVQICERLESKDA